MFPLLLLLSPAIVLLLVLLFHYAGYCTWDGKPGLVPHKTRDSVIQSCTYSPKAQRGRRFTTEERLDIAINHYLCNQKFMDYMEIEKAEQMESVSSNDLRKLFTLISYGSKEEFLRENPDCCKQTWGLMNTDQFGFWKRAIGDGNGMFNFRHKIRYMDQEGTRKEMESTRIFIMVNNCGYPKEKIYSWVGVVTSPQTGTKK